VVPELISVLTVPGRTMEREWRRLIVTAAVVGLVVLAGCGGTVDGDGGDPTGTDTTAETSTDDRPTGVNETQLRADALSAIAAVETYQVNATQEVVVEGPQPQEVSISERASIDRTNRELERNRTLRAQGQEVQIDQYVVDRTIYARSDVYVRQYSSEWIRSDVNQNFSLVWRQQDVLGQLESVLDNASGVEVTGVETVDGRETYRTRVDIAPGDFEGVLFEAVGVDSEMADNVSVDRVEYVYWLDAETARPLQTTAEIRFTAQVGGRTVVRNASTTARYGYEPVSVELPDEAGEAVNVSNEPSGRLAPQRPTRETAPPRAGEAGSRADAAVAGPATPSVSSRARG